MEPYMFVGLEPDSQHAVRTFTDLRRTDGEIAIIAKSICKVYGLRIEQLKAKTRAQPLSDARKVFYMLSRRLKGITVHQLGSYTERDHSTVVVAVQRGNGFLDVDPHFKELYIKCLLEAVKQLKQNGYEYRSDKDVRSGTSKNEAGQLGERVEFPAQTSG